MSQPSQHGLHKGPILQVPSTAANLDNNSIQENDTTMVNVPEPQLAEIDSSVRKERTIPEFLSLMENYTPVIPDAVTDYYLNKSGFQCDDVRVKRLLALATQKFIANMATDAFQYCKVRQSGNRKAGKDRKAILTMEDLDAALSEYGINIKKPEYYS